MNLWTAANQCKTKKCLTIHYFCSWTTLWVFKNTEHFQRNFYCLSFAIVAVDINAETLKKNGIPLSKFAQNVVEARSLRNITGWDYLLGNWFKIKFPKIWLYFYMTVFP